MNSFRTISAAFALAISLSCPAQVDEIRNAKFGTSFSFTPLLAYNSDLGFQLGGSASFCDYGKNPSYYPYARQEYSIAACYFTKGQVLVNGTYQSDHLIPGLNLAANISYSNDPLRKFYGFNGAEIYDSAYDRSGTYAAYCVKRNLLRVNTSFKGKIAGPLFWTGGASFRHFLIGDISFGNYNPEYTIYHQYVAEGAIRPEEARGGDVLELRAGLQLDSRDNSYSPGKGILAELFAVAAPGIGGNSYLKMCAHFRHYISLLPNRIVFAYHLAWQGRLSGNVPFYMLGCLNSSTAAFTYEEGLGGWDTIRGVMSGRLIGNSYAWCNVELRLRLLEWNTGGQTLFLGVNPFFDAGAIVEPYRQDVLRSDDAVHCSAGAGLKFGTNTTFTSIEFGKAFREQDGRFSLSVGVNYMF